MRTSFQLLIEYLDCWGEKNSIVLMYMNVEEAKKFIEVEFDGIYLSSKTISVVTLWKDL